MSFELYQKMVTFWTYADESGTTLISGRLAASRFWRKYIILVIFTVSILSNGPDQKYLRSNTCHFKIKDKKDKFIEFISPDQGLF